MVIGGERWSAFEFFGEVVGGTSAEVALGDHVGVTSADMLFDSVEIGLEHAFAVLDEVEEGLVTRCSEQ